ncbi:RDD family protein [Tersicoccus solisilvae]|uniref:RDD family protein n=1 Tax=Tersicoccus solisilvae TaxID=1882339 RepID=A0ABQ1PC39_9MICC|nr:RDD family protein [Tersicoccus solisilvae]GGC94299.1 RDD family protein [Tersicoccus solisilvae]
MVERRDIGSWLEGPPRPSTFPGHQLGAPERGPGSVARLGRRIVALFIDWGLCYLIAAAFAGGQNAVILAIFAVEQVLLLGTAGFAVGHRLLGIRLQRLDGTAPGLARAALRTVMLLLVVPALINDQDQRGLHDRAAGTILVRL